MSDARPYLSQMSEAELMDGIVQAAKLLGFKVVHFRGGRRKTGWNVPVQYDAVGWPDLVLCHPAVGRVAAIECKSASGKLTDSQRQWLNDLNLCGVESWTCNPASYHSTIDRLEAIATTTSTDPQMIFGDVQVNANAGGR